MIQPAPVRLPRRKPSRPAIWLPLAAIPRRRVAAVLC